MGDEVLRGQVQVVAAAIGAILILLMVTALLTQRVLTPFKVSEAPIAGIDAYEVAKEVGNSLGTPLFNYTISNLLSNYCLNITILNYSLITGSFINESTYVSKCSDATAVAGVATYYVVINESLYVVKVEVMSS